MDPVSVLLSEGLNSTESGTHAALSEKVTSLALPKGIAHTDDPSKEEKDKRRQHLTLSEEKGLVKQLLRRSDHGYPVTVKYLRSPALIIACKRASEF